MLVYFGWDLLLRIPEWGLWAVNSLVALMPALPSAPDGPGMADTLATPWRVAASWLWLVGLEWLPAVATWIGIAWVVWWLVVQLRRALQLVRG